MPARPRAWVKAAVLFVFGDFGGREGAKLQQLRAMIRAADTFDVHTEAKTKKNNLLFFNLYDKI